MGPGHAAWSFRDMAYPDPDRSHGIDPDVIAAKYRVALSEAKTPVIAVSHGYGPVEDVVRRFEAVWSASGGRVEINRYGYMADEKFDAFRSVVGSPL